MKRSILCSGTRRILLGFAAAALWLFMGMAARAASMTYTFTGVGNGTVDTTTWSGSFTFVFTADTSNITSGGGEFFQRNIAGTFSEGSFSAALVANNAVVVNNDPLNPRLGFFNSLFDNGGTIQDSSFSTYHLDTPFGPVTGTGANLLPTLNGSGDGFTTPGGDTIELLGMTSLTFSATPEPSTLVMASALFGIFGGVLAYKRRQWKTVAA
jgi:hypothetical protein